MDGLIQDGQLPAIESHAAETLTSRQEPVHCWISFGGNVGDVKATFDAALALLSLHCHIQLGQRSGLYCTAPMGAQAGDRFLNSICGLTTWLSPPKLLCALQSVETQLGRVRDIYWGPRTLDLDLLSYGSSIIDETKLVVPHPAVTYRRFVLDPLVEIDPEWKHPICGTSACKMLEWLKKRPLPVKLVDVPVEQVKELALQVGPRFPGVRLVSNAESSEYSLPIRLTDACSASPHLAIDLRRTPGDKLEKLTSALTAIFDEPIRVSDW